jgi:RibD C-terminal domain
MKLTGRRSYCRTRYRGGLLMRSVTYSMGVSLDGYIAGPDGNFGWTVPDEEVFRFVTDEIRQVGVHLLGRRLYETMLYWETADQDPSLDDSMLEWAAIWKPIPKVVFSTTLRRCRATPGWSPAAWRRRSSGCEPTGEGRHRARRRDSRRRGGRAGPDRRIPGQGLPGAGRRRHPVLPPARAPGGPRTRRDPHLQLRSRLPPLPRGPLVSFTPDGA